MIKISVIVPIYKVEQYIERCLRSVIAQTYQGEIECILVDDCTPDRSMDIVQQIILSYNGNIEFKIIHYDQNKGLSGARNTGIRNASGEYLYFLDSDDEITPDAIEKLVELADRYSEVDMVIGNLYAPYSMRFLFISEGIREYYATNRQINKLILNEGQLPVTAWNKLINKKFLLLNELFFEEGLLHEDQIWNFFIAKVIHSVAICHTPTYIYYINDSSIMSQVSFRRIESNLKILNIIFHNITPSQVFMQYKKGVAIGLFVLSMFWRMQKENYVSDLLKKMRRQYRFACSDALKCFYLCSFIYLLIFVIVLFLFSLVWKYFKR